MGVADGSSVGSEDDGGSYASSLSNECLVNNICDASTNASDTSWTNSSSSTCSSSTHSTDSTDVSSSTDESEDTNSASSPRFKLSQKDDWNRHCPVESSNLCSREENISSNNAYIREVRTWTEKVPIGMNLCPWAKLSHKKGRIRYVVASGEAVRTPKQASDVVWKEIQRLLFVNKNYDKGNHNCSFKQARSHLPWSTTLVICPDVEAWRTDYKTFESFVENLGTTIEHHSHKTSVPDDTGRVTLVPFHPHFARWRGLPETIVTGSVVRCHRGLAGFSKSPEAYSATVVDLQPPGFGKRRVRVRFHEAHLEGRGWGNTEQCVPVDWVVLEEEGGADKDRWPLLPDNAMHRAPYPTIHILHNDDLQDLSIHDISRLKRRNAKRMASETLL